MKISFVFIFGPKSWSSAHPGEPKYSQTVYQPEPHRAHHPPGNTELSDLIFFLMHFSSSPFISVIALIRCIFGTIRLKKIASSRIIARFFLLFLKRPPKRALLRQSINPMHFYGIPCVAYLGSFVGYTNSIRLSTHLCNFFYYFCCIF